MKFISNGVGQLSPPSAGGASLETTSIRLVQVPTICQAPEYVVEDMLRSEGFTEIQYIQHILGNTATQAQLDEHVVAVRRMPWASIVLPE